MMTSNVEVHWQQPAVTRSEKEQLNGNKGCIVWFTGLSASGKSTIANLVDQKLHKLGKRSFVLDGDNVRHHLNASPTILRQAHDGEFATRFGLGFSPQDREENIRRIGSVAKLFAESGTIALTAFISPYRADRDRVRDTMSSTDFFEVFVDTPIEICEQRDPKGMYKRARSGEIKGFTGIDDPYEKPLNPELVLKTDSITAEELADEVIFFLKSKGILVS